MVDDEMRTFSVWAPDAREMTLAIADRDHGMRDIGMRTVGDGWWSVDIDGAADDLDYGFRIDGGPVRPDPRSRRQPRGVHEPSRTFDPHAYQWGDTAWAGRALAGTVIYELHIGTFTLEGTFDAAAERLDHLVDLGVDAVEILPVNAFNGPWNWGYDGVLWFAVHEEYGGPLGYQRLVDACHRRGLAVIQDVVYNHLGASGNYLSEYGPYLRSDAANTWGNIVNLDGPGSDQVRRYILDNVRMWFEDFHVDGLRLDAVHALHDTRALTLLEEMAADTDLLAADIGRPLTLIAESDLNDPRLFTPRDAGGIGLAASWDDDIHHAIHVAVTGETSGYYTDFAAPGAVAKVLTRGYFHDGSYSSFRGRSHGRPIDTTRTPAWRLVSSIQNHDQIGNRAAGDRLAAQAGYRAQAVAAVLHLTAPFTPMLFMGEEWAASTPWPFFTSHPQPDMAEKTRAGRFAEFDRHGWDASLVPDPQDPTTFQGAKLNWAEMDSGEHAAMVALYRRLLHLRRSHPDIVTAPWPELRVVSDEARRWIVVHRGAISVAVNLSPDTQTVPIDHSGEDVRVAIMTDPAAHAAADGRGIVLPGVSAAVLVVDEPAIAAARATNPG